MNISGLSSNIDTNQIIQELLSVERIPIDNIKIKQSVLNKKKEIYNDILGRLNNLKSLASELSNSSTFNQFKITYTDQSIIQWNSTSTASEASYAITVNSIATAHTIGSDRKTSSTEALNLNTGTIQINNVNINIDSQDSLTSIRDKINNSASTTVRATIIDNVLRLQSTNTGITNQIVLVDSNNILIDLGILNGDLSIKHEYVVAADASVTIDGQNITSSSNLITNTIDGATLQLLKTGSTNVTIGRDLTAIANKIKGFVNQYNSAIDLIYTKITEKRIYPIKSESDRFAGLVNGDEILNSIKYNLNDLFVNAVNGLDGSLNNLESIGITKDSFNQSGDNTSLLAGKLIINDAKLNEALADNFEGVKNIFIKNYGIENLGSKDYGIAVRVNNYLYGITNSSTGILKSRSLGIEKENSMLESQIESITRRLEIREEALVKKFARMEQALNSSNIQLAWLQSQISAF